MVHDDASCRGVRIPLGVTSAVLKEKDNKKTQLLFSELLFLFQPTEAKHRCQRAICF